MHLFERVALDLVVERVEDIKRGDEIEDGVGEGQTRRRRARNLTLAAGPAVGEAAPGDVYPDGATVLAQQPQVVTSAAAAVQREQRTSGAARHLLDQRADEPTKSAEPEVVALGSRRRFEPTIHQRWCIDKDRCGQ